MEKSFYKFFNSNLGWLKMTPQEELRNLLEYLFYTSPAYNRFTQMLLILPQKVKKLLEMYPELMEYEEELMQLFSLEYTEKGFIETSYYGVALGAHLAGLYATLFKTLANPRRRSLLLKLAGLSEEEFKEIDPLRAWIEVSLEYLAKSNKDALKLLDIIVDKLAGKGLEEYVSWEEIRKAGNMENIEALREILRGFRLLLYESPSAIYRKECPLLLEAYSDLRRKLKELLR
jgi:hypothetical protein